MPRSVRRPKRSGTGRVSRPIPKYNMKMGPGVQGKWRMDQTALQNAERLGLSVDANERDSLTHAHVLGKRAAAGDEVVLGSLDAARSTGKIVSHVPSWRPKFHMTEDQIEYIKKLQARHGDNVSAMARDMKRNYLQKPASSLRRSIDKLREFEAWLAAKAKAEEGDRADAGSGPELPKQAAASGAGASDSVGSSGEGAPDGSGRSAKRRRRMVKVEGAAEAGVPEEREYMGELTERKLARIAPASSSSAKTLMKMATALERQAAPKHRDSSTRGSKAPYKAERQRKIAEIRESKRAEVEALRAVAEKEKKAVRRRIKEAQKVAKKEQAEAGSGSSESSSSSSSSSGAAKSPTT